MKISKLFHWLYAFLMLLPVFFIGGRCLYVTFNKNAKDSYYGETINELLPVDVDYDDIVVNELYYINGANTRVTSGNYRVAFTEMTITNVDLTGYSTFQIFANGGNTTLGIYGDNVASKYYVLENSPLIWSFRIGTYEDLNYVGTIDMYYMEPNKYSYLDNAFIYSVNELNNTPLFSWAKTSFLVAPFSYISGLFGIESTSPINTMLSYWLAISIIWLVFDLIMYVPLLVHRWIDKAKLE